MNVEKYKNYRVLVIGTGRGNPFPGHYGMEQAIDKIDGEFVAYTDPDLEKKILEYNPTHLIVYANISRKTAKTMSRIRKIHESPNYLRKLKIARKKNKKAELVVKPKTSWWFWDLRKADSYKAFKGWADKIFLCNEEYRKEWSKVFKVPVYYMPQCSTPNILYNEHDKDDANDRDIYYMGSPGNPTIHGNRKFIIEELSKKYKLELRNSNARDKRVMNSKQSPYFYANSPFCLDASADAAGYTSNRPYDILANKGLLLIEWFPGIEKVFKHKKHCLVFKTINEAIELIEYYKDKPEKRKKIAIAGYDLFLKKHTFDCRLENILQIMDGKHTNYNGYK